MYSLTPRNPTLSSIGTEALQGGGGPMSPVWILKLLVLMFINACRLLLALPSLSQFGQGRLFLVAISFYVLSLLSGPCRLSEFTLAGPLYRYYFSTLNHHNFISGLYTQAQCKQYHICADQNMFLMMKSDLVTIHWLRWSGFSSLCTVTSKKVVNIF